MGLSDARADALWAGIVSFGMTTAGVPNDTSPDVIVIGLGGDDRIFSGFALNFARHPAQQKEYCFPLCSVWKRAVAGFTPIPQTGSFSCALAEDDAGLRWSIVLAARSRLAESSRYWILKE
jgi:hypothetical protein